MKCHVITVLLIDTTGTAYKLYRRDKTKELANKKIERQDEEGKEERKEQCRAPPAGDVADILQRATETTHNARLRLILIGERFFLKFQSLEIIGDMYRYTEAFCHYS